MSTRYWTAYQVDMKTTLGGMNRNGPELEQVVHTVQQIVPEWLAEEGLVLKILFTLLFMQNINPASKNLLLLVLLFIYFSIREMPCEKVRAPSLHSVPILTPNIYFCFSGFQSSLLLIHFHYSSNTCSHCRKEWHRNLSDR